MNPKLHILATLSGAIPGEEETDEKWDIELVSISRTPMLLASAFGVGVFVEIHNVRGEV